MEKEYAVKIDEYIGKMPSLPVSSSKVLEVCDNMNVSAADLNHVISLDPVLVGRVLKLLNSAYYGLDQKVTSLVRAIIMLGINTIKNLTLSSAILGALPANKNLKGIDIEGYWRHSLCVGVIAKLLAKKRGVESKLHEEYFTAGLLHDIGKIVINAALPENYLITVSLSAEDRIPLIAMEDKELGLNHCTVGQRVAKAWKLGGPVADAIIHHHETEYFGIYCDILNCVILANYFASVNNIGFSGNRNPEMPADSIWNSLGINENAFAEIETVVNEEINKAKVFLKI